MMKSVKRVLRIVESFFNRIFRRISWYERVHFELGSIVNLYLGFNGNSDLESRTRKIDQIREKTESALAYCRLRSLAAFRGVNFRVDDPKALLEDLYAAGALVHRELIRVNAVLERQLMRRALCRSYFGSIRKGLASIRRTPPGRTNH